eukprot:1881095-Amphidinium_carterae.1
MRGRGSPSQRARRDDSVRPRQPFLVITSRLRLLRHPEVKSFKYSPTQDQDVLLCDGPHPPEPPNPQN